MTKKNAPAVQSAVADAASLETPVLTTASIPSDENTVDRQQEVPVADAARPPSDPDAVPLHKLTSRDGFPRIVAEEPNTAGLKSPEELESMEAELLSLAEGRKTDPGTKLVDPSTSLKRAKRKSTDILRTIEQSGSSTELAE